MSEFTGFSEFSSRPDPAPREARCARCGETFEFASPDDLMHFQRRNGDLCGGDGQPFRSYVIRKPTDRRRHGRRRDDG
jgi:hypothetical protein